LCRWREPSKNSRWFRPTHVSQSDISAKADQIQRLELRLIDARTNSTQPRGHCQAEVERDHAENMFLETDAKLDSLRHIFDGFKVRSIFSSSQ